MYSLITIYCIPAYYRVNTALLRLAAFTDLFYLCLITSLLCFEKESGQGATSAMVISFLPFFLKFILIQFYFIPQFFLQSKLFLPFFLKLAEI
jgi:hypothetical protein